MLGLYQKAFTNPTPLTQRDLPVVTVSQDQWYSGAPASGPKNWSRITAKKGRAPLPKSFWRLLKQEGYVAKTPASGRPSLTAAMSLCMAYREDRLPHVAETWQTLAALPHAVIIHAATGRVVLVLLSGRYAMRTWPATVVTKPHTGNVLEMVASTVTIR